ncbi:hypothetical protein [Nitrosomonas sp.]|uniref:hypothetical protein n=1 Tax=Nitrosomonas sp. TaxID=42353 RepID=UPI0037CBA5BA
MEQILNRRAAAQFAEMIVLSQTGVELPARLLLSLQDSKAAEVIRSKPLPVFANANGVKQSSQSIAEGLGYHVKKPWPARCFSFMVRMPIS